jgi:hypothetical protein
VFKSITTPAPVPAPPIVSMTETLSMVLVGGATYTASGSPEFDIVPDASSTATLAVLGFGLCMLARHRLNIAGQPKSN